MKTAIACLVLLIVGLANTRTQAQDKWFDMENCDICKCMAEHQEVMKEMKWDVYPIANGMVMVSVIPEQHRAVMKQAHEQMMKAVARLEKGEPMELCGFCKSYGALMEAGVTIEELDTVGGQITVVTTDDPDLVAKIHAHAKRSRAEHEKMNKEMAGHK